MDPRELIRQAEAITTALRRLHSIADMLEYLSGLTGTPLTATAAYDVAIRSIRDALAGRTPLCLSVEFCKERGL